jgi:hypothetical protein
MYCPIDQLALEGVTDTEALLTAVIVPEAAAPGSETTLSPIAKPSVAQPVMVKVVVPIGLEE